MVIPWYHQDSSQTSRSSQSPYLMVHKCAVFSPADHVVYLAHLVRAAGDCKLRASRKRPEEIVYKLAWI